MASARVLLIIPECPYPPRAGYALRDAQHVSILARLGWQPVLALAARRRDLSAGEKNDSLASVAWVRGNLPRDERHSRWSMTTRKIAYAAGSMQHPFACWLDSGNLC